jgi:uncharacterized protein
MPEPSLPFSHLAFAGDCVIARGSLAEVALAVHRVLQAGEPRTLLVLEAATAQVVDLDLRGSADDVVQRLALTAESASAGAVPAAGPGRPRLGVVSREVSLLPRHWDWLKLQRGGASAALRRLVDDARRQGRGQADRAAMQEAIDRYLRVMAGDRPAYEEAVRAFYANRDADLQRLAADWPQDVRSHLDLLLQRYRAVQGD